MHPALQGTGCRVAVLGVGGGALPMFLSSCFPKLIIDAVELNPLAVKAATKYMGLDMCAAQSAENISDDVPSSLSAKRQQPRVTTHIMDACRWLHLQSNERCGAPAT